MSGDTKNSRLMFTEKIHVIKKNKNAKASLAYVTYVPDKDTKTGRTKYESRLDTGRAWAGIRRSQYNHDKQKWEKVETEVGEDVLDNSPVQSIKIVNDSPIWRVNNVVWRVQDERGFQIDIASWNLDGLIHTEGVTISEGHLRHPNGFIYGFLQGKIAVIPVGSEIYEQAKQNNQKKDKKKITSLDLGDIVKISSRVSDNHIYMGRMKEVIWGSSGKGRSISLVHVYMQDDFLTTRKNISVDQVIGNSEQYANFEKNLEVANECFVKILRKRFLYLTGGRGQGFYTVAQYYPVDTLNSNIPETAIGMKIGDSIVTTENTRMRGLWYPKHEDMFVLKKAQED